MKPSKPKRLYINNESGFTMVELVIAFALLAVLVVAVTPIFKLGMDFWQTTRARVELRQNLDTALDKVSREIRQAAPGITVYPDTGDDHIKIRYASSDMESDRKFVLDGSPDGDPHYRAIYFYASQSGQPVAVTSPLNVNITAFDIKKVVFDSNEHDAVDLNGRDAYEITITGQYMMRPRKPNGKQLISETMTVKTMAVIRTQRLAH